MKSHVDPYLAEVYGEESPPQLANQESNLEGFGPGQAVPVSVPEPDIPVLLRVTPGFRIVTGTVGVRVLAEIGTVLAIKATRAALAGLASSPNVLAIEASRPGGRFDAAATSNTGQTVARPLVNERGERCLVGIIDSGIDVLHEAFRDTANEPRFIAVWDQTDSSGDSPSKKGWFKGFDTGTLHTAADIKRYIAKGAVEKQLGRDASGHGTHVASIAAGRARAGVADGVAPDAPLVVVIPKLEAEPDQPASIGYSVAHAQALKFIDEVARKHGMPVAINVSSGMNAGAHDGTSLLEAAFDELTGVGRTPGMAIIKSAGNEHKKSGHAAVEAVNQQAVTIDWDSSPGKRREDYIEGWFDSGADLTFQLTAPNGEQSTDVSIDNESYRGKLDGTSVWMQLRRFHVDNGDACLQIRLNEKSGNIRSGTWQLAIFGRKVSGETRIDFWAERVANDPYVEFKTGFDRGGTLSVPGTARSIITVAAYNHVKPNAPLLLESSRGPTRDARRKPDLCAPGVDVIAAKAGTAADGVAKSGTSMAAPFVTGAVALILSAAKKKNVQPLPNAQQIRAVLTRSCAGFNGTWTPSNGFGRIDVAAALAALGL